MRVTVRVVVRVRMKVVGEYVGSEKVDVTENWRNGETKECIGRE